MLTALFRLARGRVAGQTHSWRQCHRGGRAAMAASVQAGVRPLVARPLRPRSLLDVLDKDIGVAQDNERGTYVRR